MAIEKTLRFIVLGGIFALPFIVFLVAQSLFFPFITGKNFTFRIIVEVITGAYLALALVNPVFRPKRSWLLGLFALFVLVVALADALGVYPFKSFWSNYERMDGWVTLVHLFLYFVVASSALNTEKLWRAFWHVSLAVSAIVGVHAPLQLAGGASLNPGFSSAARIDATLGNPIYLAAYMLFHIGIASALWARAWQASVSGGLLWPSLLYGGIIAFDASALFLTGTRGAMLGLVAGVLVAALAVALSSREGRRAAALALAVVLLLGGGFFLAREQSWVKRVPSLQRLATISLDDSTTKARFYNWGMAWQGVKERPILGWGQENYAIVFDKYYDPRMYAQEPWFDRVHNIIFDWLVAGGVLGLASYLAVFAAALAALWRGRAFSLAERALFTGLLAAYFCHNFFVFDNVTSYILFGTVLAYIVFRSTHGQPAVVERRFVPSGALPFAAIGAAVLVWIVCWWIKDRKSTRLNSSH